MMLLVFEVLNLYSCFLVKENLDFIWFNRCFSLVIFVLIMLKLGWLIIKLFIFVLL